MAMWSRRSTERGAGDAGVPNSLNSRSSLGAVLQQAAQETGMIEVNRSNPAPTRAPAEPLASTASLGLTASRGPSAAGLFGLLAVTVLAGVGAAAFVLHEHSQPAAVSHDKILPNPLSAQASEAAEPGGLVSNKLRSAQLVTIPPGTFVPKYAAASLQFSSNASLAPLVRVADANSSAKATGAGIVTAQNAPAAGLPAAKSGATTTIGASGGPQPAATAPAAPLAVASARTITFGMVAPFSGPSRSLGREMKIGIESAFNQANAVGGIRGMKFQLAVADDGYQPSRTADAMNQLIETKRVFGFIGNVGTPTAAVALPIALKAHKLFFGAFTGAALLRNDPPDRDVFNYRASYAEETAATVNYLLKVRRLQPSQIAVFAQDDGYGDAGYAGVAKAYRALPGNPAPPLRFNYKRNTIEIEPAVKQLLAQHGRIKAVIMISTYRAAARFIGRTKKPFPKLIYTNISFVGSTALADELMLLGPKYADGVIVTQVVPAVDAYSTLILKYKSALASFFPGEAPDYVSLEGYIDAELLLHAIEADKQPLTTDSLVTSLESLKNYDMGLGAPLSFSMDNHQASQKVWGTQIDKDGKFHAIDLN